MLVIGAYGIEAIFVYFRLYNATSDVWSWTLPKMLRSSNFDYDIISGVVFIHRQHFGRSVAASGRTIAVGSPFADYNKLGTDLVEKDWATEGTDIFGYGRGKVYLFAGYPSVQRCSLTSNAQLSSGNFRFILKFANSVESTGRIEYSDDNTTVASLLNDLYYLDGISVKAFSNFVAAGSAEYKYTWEISFNELWQDLPVLEPPPTAGSPPPALEQRTFVIS